MSLLFYDTDKISAGNVQLTWLSLTCVFGERFIRWIKEGPQDTWITKDFMFIICPVAKWRLTLLQNHFTFKHSHSLPLAFVHYTVHFICVPRDFTLMAALSETQYTVTQLIAARERKTETVSFTASPHRNCKDRGFTRRLYTKEQDILNTAIFCLNRDVWSIYSTINKK